MGGLFFTSVLAALLLTHVAALAQTTAPTTAPTDAMWQITVTEVQGPLAVGRLMQDQPWVKLTVGMTIPKGGEIRVGSRSTVGITAPPDKKITLDRLGTFKIEPAIFENGKPADSIWSPSATLRIRSVPFTPGDDVRPFTQTPTTQPTTAP